MVKTSVLYVTSKWPGSSTSIDGGDSTIREVIEAISSFCSIDLLCFRNDINAQEHIKGIEKIIAVKEDFANYSLYSNRNGEKFNKRIEQAILVAKEIRKIAHKYHKIIVQHISLIFGLVDEDILSKTILFPMFTATSYEKSGEIVPPEYRSLEERSIRRVYKIITPSYVERDIIVRDYNVDMTRIEVIPRSVGSEFFGNTKPIQSDIRLVYVASIRLQKNHIAALRVVNRIKKAGFSVRLTCVGVIQDETIYGACLEYIHENHLIENVLFVGNKTNDEIRQIFAENDINVSVSSWETFGRGIYEGMSMGLPTVVFDSLQCVIESSNIGVYPIVVNTEENMASEIIRLATDKDYYESESKKKIKVRKKLCFEEIAKQLIDAI